MHIMGLVSLGLMWLRMAKVASAKLAAGTTETAFYQVKLTTARFYFAKLLPETAGLIRSCRAGLKPLMEMDEALF
jgi:hypothetical protein